MQLKVSNPGHGAALYGCIYIIIGIIIFNNPVISNRRYRLIHLHLNFRHLTVRKLQAARYLP